MTSPKSVLSNAVCVILTLLCHFSSFATGGSNGGGENYQKNLEYQMRFLLTGGSDQGSGGEIKSVLNSFLVAYQNQSKQADLKLKLQTTRASSKGGRPFSVLDDLKDSTYVLSTLSSAAQAGPIAGEPIYFDVHKIVGEIRPRAFADMILPLAQRALSAHLQRFGFSKSEMDRVNSFMDSHAEFVAQAAQNLRLTLQLSGSNPAWGYWLSEAPLTVQILRQALADGSLKAGMLNYLRRLGASPSAMPPQNLRMLATSDGQSILATDISSSPMVEWRSDDSGCAQIRDRTDEQEKKSAKTRFGTPGSVVCFKLNDLVQSMGSVSVAEGLLLLEAVAFHEEIHHFQPSPRNPREREADESAAYQAQSFVLNTLALTAGEEIHFSRTTKDLSPRELQNTRRKLVIGDEVVMSGAQCALDGAEAASVYTRDRLKWIHCDFSPGQHGIGDINLPIEKFRVISVTGDSVIVTQAQEPASGVLPFFGIFQDDALARAFGQTINGIQVGDCGIAEIEYNSSHPPELSATREVWPPIYGMTHLLKMSTRVVGILNRFDTQELIVKVSGLATGLRPVQGLEGYSGCYPLLLDPSKNQDGGIDYLECNGFPVKKSLGRARVTMDDTFEGIDRKSCGN